MANIQLPPSDTLTIDDVEYLVYAMPATAGLQFMEKHQEAIDNGRADLSMMKQIICKYVQKDRKVIDEKTFDAVFARKYGHLQKLYQAVLAYNFDDVFQAVDSEE